MIGELNNILQSMEDGIYNFTKDGKCSECGQCCSALLPLSQQELRTIKKYVKKHGLKPHNHDVLSTAQLDLTCPFLNNNKGKRCDIYEVRPKICRVFVCNQPPSKVKENKEMFWKTRQPYYMWEMFREVEE